MWGLAFRCDCGGELAGELVGRPHFEGRDEARYGASTPATRAGY